MAKAIAKSFPRVECIVFEFCESSEKVFEFACMRIFVVVRGSNRKREEVEEGRNFPSSKRRRFGKGWRSK